ncbi:MAG: iron-containing alcohol dehydrogenase [Desulfovibrio sp.]|nr:iron-containing alcohol dehydrogenase [Desulfovibrio sp.]
MSKNFTVKSSVHDYTVTFCDDAVAALRESLAPGDTIFIDQVILTHHGERLAPVLETCPHLVLQASEEAKSFQRIGGVIEQLIQGGFRKNNKIVAIGGGIVQDITAFIASNLYRGVEWHFFPTTLLAQADSCIGGKSSLNFGAYKNLLGNFYPPTAICIDLSFLQTLPRKEIVSGLGEMTHFFFLNSEADFALMRDSYTAALTDPAVLEKLIHRSLSIKKATIEIDEFDRKERQIFNYGHSFGHAIESVTNYRIPHGIAVSHGMDIANYISMKLGLIDQGLYQKMRDVLQLNWNEVPLGDIDVDAIINALRKDKKNIGAQVRVILTKGLGNMFITSLDVDGEGGQWLREYFRTMV